MLLDPTFKTHFEARNFTINLKKKLSPNFTKAGRQVNALASRECKARCVQVQGRNHSAASG